MDPVLTEGWFALSLVQQMINIGNEVKRAVRFDQDEEKKHAFMDKAIQYADLTMQDPKNRDVLPELVNRGQTPLRKYERYMNKL